MQKIYCYRNENGVKLRLIVRGNTIYYSAKDVCDFLGISNVSSALKEIDSKDKTSVTTASGMRLYMINSMAFRFLACSPGVKDFISWADSRGELLLKRAKPVSVEEDEGFYTMSEYADKHGFTFIKAEASRLGKIAAQVSKEYGLPIHKHEHDLFGSINAYAEQVLDEVVGPVGVLDDADEA